MLLLTVIGRFWKLSIRRNAEKSASTFCCEAVSANASNAGGVDSETIVLLSIVIGTMPAFGASNSRPPPVNVLPLIIHPFEPPDTCVAKRTMAS